MAEITVPPSDQKPASQQCSARPDGFLHCTHMTAAPVQGPGSMMFPKACCFCAPEWMKLVILVPHTIDREMIAAEAMQHGHMILFEIAADPAKQIAVGGAIPPTNINGRGRHR